MIQGKVLRTAAIGQLRDLAVDETAVWVDADVIDHLRALSFDEWMGELRSVERSAFHLERQRFYAMELDVFDRWLAGDRTPSVDEPGFREWYELVAEHVSRGRADARVRVLEAPTDYQNFELWCGQWNVAHGEVLRSVSRSTVERVGLVTPEGAIMSGIRLALGEGLFTAEHDRWKVQRRLMQPMEPPEDHQDREGRPVPKR